MPVHFVTSVIGCSYEIIEKYISIPPITSYQSRKYEFFATHHTTIYQANSQFYWDLL